MLRKNMIQAQYQMMHQFLIEEERFQLAALNREAEEILQELRDSGIRMAQHREELKEMYRELTEMCHKPDMALLQVSREGPSSETGVLVGQYCLQKALCSAERHELLHCYHCPITSFCTFW